MIKNSIDGQRKRRRRREAEGEGGGRKLKLKGDPQGKVTFASSGTDANWRRSGPRERVTAASGSIKDLSHPDRGGGDGGACCAWVIRGEREREVQAKVAVGDLELGFSRESIRSGCIAIMDGTSSNRI